MAAPSQYHVHAARHTAPSMPVSTVTSVSGGAPAAGSVSPSTTTLPHTAAPPGTVTVTGVVSTRTGYI